MKPKIPRKPHLICKSDEFQGKLPLSCNMSAEFGSNSKALVKSAIAWY